MEMMTQAFLSELSQWFNDWQARCSFIIMHMHKKVTGLQLFLKWSYVRVRVPVGFQCIKAHSGTKFWVKQKHSGKDKNGEVQFVQHCTFQQSWGSWYSSVCLVYAWGYTHRPVFALYCTVLYIHSYLNCSFFLLFLWCYKSHPNSNLFHSVILFHCKDFTTNTVL